MARREAFSRVARMEKGPSAELAQAEEAIANAWSVAAQDLDLVITLKQEAFTRSGERVVLPVRIESFGSRRGAACRSWKADADQAKLFHKWGEEAGVFTSVLRGSYEVYDRELWVATLDDWGWFGHGKPPWWYSGKPWTD
jgi:hypothetical protein